MEHTPYSSLLQQSDSITIENLDTYSVSSQRTELNVDQLLATDSVMQHLQALQDILNKNTDSIFDEVYLVQLVLWTSCTAASYLSFYPFSIFRMNYCLHEM